MSVNSVQQQQLKQKHQELLDQQKKAQEKNDEATRKAFEEQEDAHQDAIELQNKENYQHTYGPSGREITDFRHLDPSNDPN